MTSAAAELIRAQTAGHESQTLFAAVPDEVLYDRRLKGDDIRVYAVYARHAAWKSGERRQQFGPSLHVDAGDTWIGQRAVGGLLDISEDAVSRRVARLKRAGHLSARRRGHGKTSITTVTAFVSRAQTAGHESQTLFAAVPDEVLYDRRLTGDDVRVYAVFARHAAWKAGSRKQRFGQPLEVEPGDTWIGQRTAGELLGRSEDQVYRSIKRLKTADHLASRRRGYGKTSLYTVTALVSRAQTAEHGLHVPRPDRGTSSAPRPRDGTTPGERDQMNKIPPHLQPRARASKSQRRADGQGTRTTRFSGSCASSPSRTGPGCGRRATEPCCSGCLCVCGSCCSPGPMVFRGGRFAR